MKTKSSIVSIVGGPGEAMKHLLLLTTLSTLSGCASFGNVTRLKDAKANEDVVCSEMPNKFTSIVGFSVVGLDTHDIPTYRHPDGHDERTQPYRQGNGCKIFGHLTILQDVNMQQEILCWESCNKYTKEHGFAIVKIDNHTEPNWMAGNIQPHLMNSGKQHYQIIPLKVSRTDRGEDQ